MTLPRPGLIGSEKTLVRRREERRAPEAEVTVKTEATTEGAVADNAAMFLTTQGRPEEEDTVTVPPALAEDRIVAEATEVPLEAPTAGEADTAEDTKISTILSDKT